jgi:hypothetical protein
MDRKYTTREDWAAAVSDACNGYSWHTRSGIGAARDCVSAFCGDKCIGYWHDAKNEGYVTDRVLQELTSGR